MPCEHGEDERWREDIGNLKYRSNSSTRADSRGVERPPVPASSHHARICMRPSSWIIVGSAGSCSFQVSFCSWCYDSSDRMITSADGWSFAQRVTARI